MMEDEKQQFIDVNYLDEKMGRLATRYAAIGDFETAKLYNFVRTVLDTAPIIDAVVVVRCEDCDHLRHNDEGGTYCAITWTDVDDDDFCSFGRRKYE